MRRLSPGLLVGMVVAASAAATAASAADLPVPAAAPPVAYRPAIYDWGGFYVGGQIGAGAMNDTITQLTTTGLFNVGSTDRTNPWSVVGGGEAGVNVEFAPFVIGVE